MDGITRKCRQCDCHIARRGILDRKKDGEALGKGEGLCTGIPDWSVPKTNFVFVQHLNITKLVANTLKS